MSASHLCGLHEPVQTLVNPLLFAVPAGGASFFRVRGKFFRAIRESPLRGARWDDTSSVIRLAGDRRMPPSPQGEGFAWSAQSSSLRVNAIPRKAKMQASLATPTVAERSLRPKCFSPPRKPARSDEAASSICTIELLVFAILLKAQRIPLSGIQADDQWSSLRLEGFSQRP